MSLSINIRHSAALGHSRWVNTNMEDGPLEGRSEVSLKAALHILTLRTKSVFFLSLRRPGRLRTGLVAITPWKTMKKISPCHYEFSPVHQLITKLNAHYGILGFISNQTARCMWRLCHCFCVCRSVHPSISYTHTHQSVLHSHLRVILESPVGLTWTEKKKKTEKRSKE